jgi:hypothetical protein
MSDHTDRTPESQLPECRVLATLEPAAFIRFEVSMSQIEDLHETVREDFLAASGEEIVPVKIGLERDAFTAVTDGMEKLKENLPRQGVTPVPVTDEPDIALTVLVSESQLEQAIEVNKKVLSQSEAGDRHGQEFGITQTAALVLIHQLEAAIDGSPDPIESVDMDEIRQSLE